MAQPKPERTSLEQVLKLASELTPSEQHQLSKKLSAESLFSSNEVEAEKTHNPMSTFNRERAIRYLTGRLANKSADDQSWNDIKCDLDSNRRSGRKLFDA